jgi:cell division ATPase FtsA|tara:strand:+ start:13817 stop:14029 length:213 start_codon:yes stop_codon:yes gene_type:complete
MKEEIRNIRTQNDLILAIATAIEERNAEDLEDMHTLIQDWMIDDESIQVLEDLIGTATNAAMDLKDFEDQ